MSDLDLLHNLEQLRDNRKKCLPKLNVLTKHIGEQLLISFNVLITSVYDLQNVLQASRREQVLVNKSEQAVLTFDPNEHHCMKIRINLALDHHIHIASSSNWFHCSSLVNGRCDFLIHICYFVNVTDKHSHDVINDRLILLRIG